MSDIDKSGWGEGPWQSEPDRVDFVHAGLACLALRHPWHGYWCGYAAVPREHPLYGIDWKGLPEGVELDVHMGVNYSAPCDGIICHLPEPGMPEDVWWFGFDTGHFMDFAPARAVRERTMGFPESEAISAMEVYRTLPYVRLVIESLAEQLAAMTGGV